MTRLAIVSWLACGILSAGFGNKMMDDGFKWSSKKKCESVAARDQSSTLMVGLIGGPFSLIVVLGFSGFGHNGWSLERHECNY